MSSSSRWLMAVSPAEALAVFTLGLLLIFVELNRPGRVIYGAIGLLLTLLVTARLAMAHPRPIAELLVLPAGAILALGLVRKIHWVLAVAATLALVLGFRALLVPAVAWWVCILCGLVLGATTAVLTGVARMARTNKASRQSTENMGISGDGGNV